MLGNGAIKENFKATLVSVIIVNTNERQHLSRCLPSLMASTFPNFEVIVVDNASEDGSVEYLNREFPEVRVLESDVNLGYAGANNTGFVAASGNYVVVLNPDTVVEENWLSELVDAMSKHEGVALATPKILTMRDGTINACGNEISFTGLTACRGYGEQPNEYSSIEYVSAVSGAAFCITRSALEILGGFDESLFLYYEDTDLSLRALLAGYQCLFVPQAVVHHDYGFRFTPMKNFLLERNRILVWLKTFKWKTLIAMAPVLILGEVITWGYATLRGPQYLWAKLRAYFWLITHTDLIRDARVRQQRIRIVDDCAVLRQMTHRLRFRQTVPQKVAVLLEAVFHPLIYLFARFALWILGCGSTRWGRSRI